MRDQGSCSQAGLKLSGTQGWPCITDPGAGITGVSRRAWFIQCWGLRPGPRASWIRTLPSAMHPQCRDRLLYFSSLTARCAEGEASSPDEEAAVGRESSPEVGRGLHCSASTLTETRCACMHAAQRSPSPPRGQDRPQGMCLNQYAARSSACLSSARWSSTACSWPILGT